MPELFEPYRTEPYADFTKQENLEAYRQALREGKSQLGQDYPLTIGGDKVETGRWMTSHNPCRASELVGRTARAGQKEVDKAMDAAWDAYAYWSRLPMDHRARCLVKLAAVMRRRKRELAAWMTLEAGKNFLESEADVAEAIDFAEYYARQAITLDGPLQTHDYPGEENTSFLVPIGVGAIIPPWNFPLAILAGMAVGPAVAGNTVIVKPSPDTPIIGQKFMTCVEEAGFPPGVINFITGADADIGDYLVDHPRTRFINFTGSLQTGLRISERAAKVQPGQRWLKKVFCELGGKDALIVDETADLDYAAEMATQSGYGFQGQKCSAMSRLIIVKDVHDELLARFTQRVQALTLGPAEDNAQVCAVINQKAEDKILSYIEIGKGESRLVLGGAKAEGEGYYLEPTIFSDVPEDARIAQEEIFGPVVSVLKAKDYDDALRIANGTVFGLTGGVISQRRDRLEQARREFQVGNLYLNRKITGALVGVQPFGGYKLSGSNAKAGGPDYVRLFMEMKTVTERF